MGLSISPLLFFRIQLLDQYRFCLLGHVLYSQTYCLHSFRPIGQDLPQHRINTEFALYGNNNYFARTDTVFYPISKNKVVLLYFFSLIEFFSSKVIILYSFSVCQKYTYIFKLFCMLIIAMICLCSITQTFLDEQIPWLKHTFQAKFLFKKELLYKALQNKKVYWEF